MRVEPELLDHPKFLRLEKLVGPPALKCLMRIWGHCQTNQRGEFWPGADADYVEIVARWTGEAGVLFRSLLGVGLIQDVQGGVRIHDWDVMNSKTISNWYNGKKGGRPPKTQNGFGLTQTKPNSDLGSDGSKTGSKSPSEENPTETQSQIGLTQTKPIENPSSFFPSFNHSEEGKLRYELAQGRLKYLNELTGAKFPESPATLRAIAERLAEVGNDVEGVDKMLRHRFELWRNDPDMKLNLRPRTLFDERYFADYYGQRDMALNGKADIERLKDAIQTSPANPNSIYYEANVSATEKAKYEENRRRLAELQAQLAKEKAA